MRFNKLLLALLPCALLAQIGGSFLSGDLVRGGSAMTTPGLVPVVSAPGTLGQSDVSLASGIFSRAGTLGLSATGANVLTFSTNGSERGRFKSSGEFGLGTADPQNTLHVVGVGRFDTSGYILRAYDATGTTLRGYLFTDGANFQFDTVQNQPLDFLTAGVQRVRIGTSGNLLIGTTTDDGASKLQVQTSAGKFTVANAGGASVVIGSSGSMQYNVGAASGHEFLLNGVTKSVLTAANSFIIGGTSEGNYRLDVQSSGSTGTMRVYDQTAVTGSSTLVVRAGPGQSTTALQTWQNNAGATLASVSSGGIVSSVNTAANAGFSADSGTGASYYLSGLSVRHGGVIRWYLYKNNDSAGNFYISRYDDAGAHLGDPISINRSAGYVSIAESGSRVGFFGVTPVVRQTATDLASVLTALQNLGLIN